MFDNLKKRLKKYPKIRKTLRTIINYTYVYVKNGYYKNMLLYFVKYRNSEKRALKKYGFRKSKIHNTHFWRYNDGTDRVYRRYYSAFLNDKKVFVKICKNDSTAQNEIKIYKYLASFDIPFLLKAESHSLDFNKGYSMLSLDFCTNLKPFAIPSTVDEFSNYCRQFLAIIGELNKIKLLHADIHKNNLVLNDKDELCLLDFGISISQNVENSVNYLARPGTYYIQNDNIRIYDDAYSFVKMVEQLNPRKEFLECDEYKQVCEKIDEFSIRLDMNQFK